MERIHKSAGPAGLSAALFLAAACQSGGLAATETADSAAAQHATSATTVQPKATGHTAESPLPANDPELAAWNAAATADSADGWWKYLDAHANSRRTTDASEALLACLAREVVKALGGDAARIESGERFPVKLFAPADLAAAFGEAEVSENVHLTPMRGRIARKRSTFRVADFDPEERVGELVGASRVRDVEARFAVRMLAPRGRGQSSVQDDIEIVFLNAWPRDERLTLELDWRFEYAGIGETEDGERRRVLQLQEGIERVTGRGFAILRVWGETEAYAFGTAKEATVSHIPPALVPDCAAHTCARTTIGSPLGHSPAYGYTPPRRYAHGDLLLPESDQLVHTLGAHSRARPRRRRGIRRAGQ